jgi:hypothetical protein
MTTDERLFAWFLKHPKALPEGWVLTHSLKTPTHLFPHLSWIDDGTRLALTMALLRWVSEQDTIGILGPPQDGGSWIVGVGDRMIGPSEDLLTALLKVAEAMEESE